MKCYSGNDACYDKVIKIPYLLIGGMVLIIIFITLTTYYRLYQIGLEEQKNRLAEIVESRTVMINLLVEQQRHLTHHDQTQTIEEAVLKGLMIAHREFSGFGETGEYTLAKIQDNKIHFLLRHRHNEMNRMDTILIDDKLAEPMQRALNGQSGSLIGLDYRGHEVVAAHKPISHLGWGIVAKIDMNEIRIPYAREAVFALIGALLLIGASGIFIIRITRPLLSEIENSRQYNRKLFNESPIGLALTDMQGKMVDVNPAYLTLIGYTKEEISHLSYWDITPKKYMAQEEAQLKEIYEKGSYGPYEKEYIHKNGSSINVRLSGTLLERDGEHFIWSSVEDITKEKHDEMRLREAALVFEHTHEGIMVTDGDNHIIRTNNTFTQITGYSFEEAKGREPKFLQSGSHDQDFYRDMWKKINEEGIWLGELKNRRRDGEFFTSLQSISSVKNRSGEVTGYVSVFTDISNRKNYEMQLAHIANHDGLTALPNRMHFNDNLEQAIHFAKRQSYKLAVLFLDLNDFKEVNDTMGHRSGDMLLQEVAIRLKRCIREEDTVARLGGDEFAILLTELKEDDDAITVSKKIVKSLSEPFDTGQHTITTSTSIGISIYPEHADNGEMLLQLADKAMYSAKQKSTEKYELYDAAKRYET